MDTKNDSYLVERFPYPLFLFWEGYLFYTNVMAYVYATKERKMKLNYTKDKQNPRLRYLTWHSTDPTLKSAT